MHITVTPTDDPEFVLISYEHSGKFGVYAHHCIARTYDPQQQAEKIAKLERLYFGTGSAARGGEEA